MYKFCIFLSFFSLLAFNTNAQRKDIRLNFGIQGNFPESFFYKRPGSYNGKNSGFALHLYPKWYYSEKLSLGINMEYALVTEDARTDAIKHYDIFSFAPTAQYYFLQGNIRPFTGMGLGLYHVAYHYPALHFGLRPVIGVSFDKIFDLSLEYNKFFGNMNINPNVSAPIHNYYVGLKGSFGIGLAHSKRK